MLRVSIILLLFQVNFYKENINLVLMGKMLLIHAIEITPKKIVSLSFTYYHDIGSIILWFDDNGFGSGSKNGINRPSLHGEKLTAEFPKVAGLGYIFLTHCGKTVRVSLVPHCPMYWSRGDSERAACGISAIAGLV